MDDRWFTEADVQQMERLGIPQWEVERQLALFEKKNVSVELHRPCTLGDGILGVDAELERVCVDAYTKGLKKGRFIKFVPASGAATRMFQDLFPVLGESPVPDLSHIRAAAEAGDEAARRVQTFFDNARRFAFFEAWREAVSRLGADLEEDLRAGRIDRALKGLLTAEGLDLGRLPKALIPFHRYEDGPRTALEEHLAEAARIVCLPNGVCPVHFTVSPEHERRFLEHIAAVRPRHEALWDCAFQITLSEQSTATDTLAVDEDNRPFRDASGRLVFRPAGHGALLYNLNRLKGDLVFIKNIDNVVPDYLKPETIRWKKILGGFTILMQERIHRQIKALRTRLSSETVEQVRRFVQTTFWGSTCAIGGALIAQRDLLLHVLNRPLRVCGMVRNVGEPGGGPFWAWDREGRLTCQIVEKAQVNMADPRQRAVWERATHFNPVDLVCAVRDPEGNPYDLLRYRDPDAVIITKKSLEGRPLKALELPGLWNGSMALWNTVFVEVPSITFNPVKTVLDLLRPEHQPRDTGDGS
uniref:DUF4301 family protein n=1 Tax=Desulfacinum infernum TaxID=35837 RepID=A0A832A633_9BACT